MAPRTASSVEPIVYPESDGKPIADNTLQFRWIVTLVSNIDAMFADDADVFVAGDLLWYPVEGQPAVTTAPDTMVVFGRPRGERGSYLQWQEGGLPPQVVFEVLSPNNTRAEMARKRDFYEEHGVEEYYLYDPDRVRLSGWRRAGDSLVPIPEMDGWTSPRLGIRFDLSTGPELIVYRPDGSRFLTPREREQREQEARARAAAAEQAAGRASRRADRAKKKAEKERAAKDEVLRQNEALREKLRRAGVDPDA